MSVETKIFEGTWEEAINHAGEIPRDQIVSIFAIKKDSKSVADIIREGGYLGNILKDLNRDHFYFTASQEQFENALNEIAEMNKNLPALPDEAFDRENLYEDR